MKKIDEIMYKYKNDLLSLDNVIGVGKGIKEIKGRKINKECITVLVNNKLEKAQLNSRNLVPQSIEEEETDVIEVGDVELLDALDSRIERARPAKPGMSIGHYKITAGTFGIVVNDKKTDEPLILSNNHVLANISNGRDGKANKGDEILQPGSYDGGKDSKDVIAYLERFTPIYSSKKNRQKKATAFSLSRGINRFFYAFSRLLNPGVEFDKENKVDCAVAKPKSREMISNEVMGLGKVKGMAEPELGMEVIKSGRTTGVTKSIVKAIDVTIKVRVSDSESAFFNEQIVTESFSKPGDSGSIVMNKDNEVVGLLFAGSEQSSILNKINNVCDALKVEL